MFLGLQFRADIEMDQRLESENYSNEETVMLKIPISLPYQFHPEGFQQASGTFEYNGEYFNLVQQKIENDTLFAVCIKNLDKSALSETMTNFEKVINNWPQSSKKAYNLINTFIKDYNTCSATHIICTLGWVLSRSYFIHDFSHLKRAIIPGTPPPESIV
jgi:hypothetical protein